MMTESFVCNDALILKKLEVPAPSVRELSHDNEPSPRLPGDRIAPACIETAPATVPFPPTAPPTTVTGQASEPRTISFPNQLVTVPVKGFVPEKVNVPELDLEMLIAAALPF